VAALVDTNVLVYRFDKRFPGKQRIARDLLRDRLAHGDVRIPHPALVEFVAAVTRTSKDVEPLLSELDSQSIPLTKAVPRLGRSLRPPPKHFGVIIRDALPSVRWRRRYEVQSRWHPYNGSL
jgi:predicted nucleic acid-binding protein